MSGATLSKRAAKTLERIKRGDFYKWDGKALGPALAELRDAGLIALCGRVQTTVLCWVPSKGYTPATMEAFEQPKEQPHED